MKKIAGAFAMVALIVFQTTPAFAQIVPPPVGDTTPPVISAIVVTSVSSIAENVTWVTDELAISTFEYGTTTSYGSSASISGGAAIGGTVALTGLTPATTYYYCIHSTDTSGNASSACGQSFTTAAAPDTTAPTLSAIVVTSLATSTATVTWTTSEAASAQVAYGTTTSYGSTSSLDGNLALTHSATIIGLTPNTIYHYQVHSTDAAGNLATSTDATFTTESIQVVIPPDTTPPVIASISTASVSNIAATITWATNELATSTLVYGTTTSYGNSATLSATALLAHEAALVNLSPQTTYYYCIYATDLAGNTSNSCGHSFTTGSTPDTTPPVISNISEASVSPYDATIAWSTNELATSSIRYGTAANNLALTLPVSASGALVHEATILSLASGTAYYYCIDATDLVGNTASSCGHSFTTGVASSAPPPDTNPPTILLVTVVPIATSTASITWTTSEVANGQVEYGTSTAYGSSAGLDTDFSLTDEANLTGLTPNTTYHYKIRSSDQVGNVAYSNDNTFTTGALPEITPETNPPVISEVATTSVSSVAATIVWTTNELAVSTMSYGTSLNYGSLAALPTTAFLAHSATLTNLSPNTTYYYCIHATDVWGNAASSCGQSFTTPVSGEITNPAPTSTPTSTPNVSSTVNFSAIETQSVGTSTVTITWNTDLPASGQVEYGTSEQLGSATPLNATLSTSHSVTITGLTPNTNYTFRVASTPSGAPSASFSTNYEFNTLAVPTFTTTPANVSAVAATSVSTSTADIAWITDQAASAEVQYGISTEYGQSASSTGALATSHTIVLNGLAPETTYHYRVKSVNAAGDITYSSDHTFTTAAPISISLGGGGNNGGNSTVSAPAAVNNLSIADYDPTSVTLTWNVSSANADAAAEYDIRYSTSSITQNNFGSATQDQVTAILYPDLEPNGTARTYIVAGLNPNTTYYFAITSKYEVSAWAPISNVVTATTEHAGQPEVVVENNSGATSGGVGGGSSVSVSAGGGGSGAGASGGAISGPIGSPTLTSAAGDDSQITLNWNNPGTNSFVRTIVVKKAGSYPTSPTDGQVIYEGNGGTFTDTSVSNGTTYYYAIYSYDRAKNYSSPIRVSLAPQAGVTQSQLNENPTITTGGPEYHFTQVYDQGDTDPEVAHLQEMLARYNVYPENRVTSYFGPLTEAALKRFQAMYGIPQTGIVDTQTQILLNAASLSDPTMNVPWDLAVFDTDLQLGMRSEDVGELQQFLIYEGAYPEAQVTGYFGTLTQKAVIAFQQKYGILPDVGYVGPITRHTIATISGF